MDSSPRRNGVLKRPSERWRQLCKGEVASAQRAAPRNDITLVVGNAKAQLSLRGASPPKAEGATKQPSPAQLPRRWGQVLQQAPELLPTISPDLVVSRLTLPVSLSFYRKMTTFTEC